MMFPKSTLVRSEKYRRLVAALPCINCGVWFRSQAAHPPPTGKGIKESDLECFPLCCASVERPGCHADFDQYRIVPKEEIRELAKNWANKTRQTIIQMGDMPKELI